ncbi:hypothetical protein ASD12_23560 [Mesorhizobium sp. Root102]|uniref:alpha-hydroxy-acid oxidizing protein n=1 Tax=Mesorhizobium sp. Root102 TaxID=1736422 RepID=UPI0007017B63|nr:alpha-hydroxy-acid oxidizing protein [Mesorhizobium sp. Root102]KQU95492.1 hypothetical protein ASD12_23560 [Mesorhizobium sp. Root102]
MLVGRAFLFGTATGDEKGVLGVMKKLQDEIDRSMAYLGFLNVGELHADLLFSKLSTTIVKLTEMRAADAA